MISHEHRCIFIHVPRTGGTSIEDVLWPGPRDVTQLWMGFVAPHRNKYQTGGLQHLLARQVLDEVGEATFASYFKFAFVRNPWDRAVSQYHYVMRRPDIREHAGLRPGDSFKRFLERIQECEHVQWEEQHKFVTDQSGETMVDFIGRFERFEADVRSVLKRLHVDADTIPHKNKTEHAPYREHYDNETIEIVRRQYEKDVVAFGYTLH